MSATAAAEFPADVPASGEAALPRRRRAGLTFLFAVFAAALSFVSFRTQLVAVWQHGTFFDTDDATRLIQIRNLLAGQNWFDMTIRPMDPPQGVFMHWSRVVDVPVAVLIKAFGLVADTTTAERLARLAFPLALLVGLYLGLARLAALLMGPAARIPMIAAATLSGNGIGQFLPGRIDHHAPQIVTLVFMLGCAVAALESRAARQAAVAGVLAALSLAISLENLPFIVALAAALVAIWIWQGPAMDRMLAWFAGALAVSLLVFFGATVGPDRYLAPVCDAFGAAHLGAGLIGAIGCGSAALLGLPTRVARAGAAALIAGCIVGFMVVCYPACLHSPFAGLDPLVREIWMNQVEEAKPFLVLLRDDPGTALISLLPVVLGLAGCLFATWHARGLTRLQFAVVSAIVAVGLAMAFWQVRVFAFVTAIALAGGVYVALTARQHWLDRGRENLASLAWLLLFPFTATAVTLVAPAEAATDPDLARASRCLLPAAYAPLADLPPGTVLAPTDLGAFILEKTKLAVFAAPYHRNNDGNRFAFETMLAPPDVARRRMSDRGTRYLIACPGIDETTRLAARNPDSLAAALVSGRTPGWLPAVPLRNTPLKVFTLASSTQ